MSELRSGRRQECQATAAGEGGAYQCTRCMAKPAEVCHECVRALALKWFGAIARHPEAGIDCRICEAGLPQFCGDCFVVEVAEYRALLRAQGHTIAGEPAFGVRFG